MADFTSSFWAWWVLVLVVASFIGMVWLLLWQSEKKKPGEAPQPMGHVWDEDLQELNNPLPAWWLIMFWVTLVFGAAYLVIYPGLGLFSGIGGWTQLTQYEKEMAQAEQTYGPLYEGYSKVAIADLAKDPEAMKTGARLFINYCSVCHATDAGGGPGFPNLRDGAWLYGGQPEQIHQSILNGRAGVMPAWKDALGGDEGVKNVTAYTLSLSGRKVDVEAARKGQEKYNQLCVACHGADGTGNIALGAPNLTDDIWLYGGSTKAVMDSIANGRQGKMPAQKDILGEDKVHLLSAYVYSLSAQ